MMHMRNVFLLTGFCVLALSFMIYAQDNNDTKADSPEENPFTKQVEVFGVHVYATSSTPDDKVLHAANVLAQYLDNDEDGVPDDQAVVDAMVKNKAAMSMRKGEHEFEGTWRSLRRKYLPPGTHPQLLWGDETTLGAIDSSGKVLRIDVSWEEILHLVHVYGYAVVYPETFGMRPGTKIADAMDLARGGFFEEVPEQYPEEAWLAYYDKSCDYGCQIAEYFHWALCSVLGAQDFPGRLENIEHNWKLNTREKVMKQDPAVYVLVTDPRFKLPTVLPDGKYKAKKLAIQPYGK